MNIYTGNNLKVGHSAHAETGETITVEDKNHPGAPAWIDNPGVENEEWPLQKNIRMSQVFNEWGQFCLNR